MARWRKPVYTRDQFLEYFIRENLGRYAMEFYEGSKRHTRKQMAMVMIDIQKRAFDRTRCNHACKAMYFCDLKRKHTGRHKSNGLAWEDRDGNFVRAA
jgi:hypothetical protein